MVETAILLPLLMLLMLGVCEAGWYMHCAQVVHNAARQGARAAMELGNSNAEVEAAVQTALNNAAGIEASAVTTEIYRLTDYGVEQYQVQNLNENEQGEAVKVKVSISFGEMSFATNFLALEGQTLSGHAVMRRRQ